MFPMVVYVWGPVLLHPKILHKPHTPVCTDTVIHPQGGKARKLRLPGLIILASPTHAPPTD